MNFNNPIARAVQPKFHEGSQMRSVRDSDANSRAWARNKTTQQQDNVYGNAIHKIQRQIEGLKRRIVGGFTPPSLPTADFFPFKVYQPSNVSAFKTGVAFLNRNSGVATQCNIDSTVPTDFSANPPTVNPATDGWRIWAVRAGQVELRPIYTLATIDGGFQSQLCFSDEGDTIIQWNNWSLKYFVLENTDGTSPFSSAFGTPGAREYSDPSTKTLFQPIIFGGPRDPVDQGNALYGGINFSVWLEITPDTDTHANPPIIPGMNVRIVGGNWWTSNNGPGGNNNPFPAGAGPMIIPIATMNPTFQGDPGTGSFTTNFIVDQEVFNHVINRYPPGIGTGFLGGGGFGSNVMNIRGAVYDDDTTDPEDLVDQVFYPGDVVVLNPGDIVGTNRMYQFIGIAGDGKPNYWADPKTTNRWRQIFAGQTI